MTWKYVGKQGRLYRLEKLASRMFQRHQAVYGALLRAGIYDSRNPTPELVRARYWLAFAQHSYRSAVGRRDRNLRFSTDARWVGLAVAESFDAIKAEPQIIPDKEEGGWLIKVKELRGCMTQADRWEAVLPMIEEGKALWLEVSLEYGDPIPEPEGVVSSK